MTEQEEAQITNTTITFDGEVFSAWVDDKEVSTDRSLGALKVRTRKRYEHVTFVDATKPFEPVWNEANYSQWEKLLATCEAR